MSMFCQRTPVADSCATGCPPFGAAGQAPARECSADHVRRGSVRARSPFRLASPCLVLILLSLIVPLSARAGVYSGGTGTSGDPYLLSTLADLQELSETPSDWASGIYFELTADIDASATSGWNGGLGFSPIGNSGNSFVGSFNGNGHVITGLTINRPLQDFVGFIGYSGGSVQSLGLDLLSVSGRDYVGGLVGRNDGTSVSACYATGSVSGRDYIGGLIGFNFSSLVGSYYATGSVAGVDVVGGLVGQNNGTVSSCYATGNALSMGPNVGGLVGQNNGTVNSCYWDTETSGTTTGIGSGTSAGATGLTSAETMVQSSFTGFDFTSTPGWRIFDGATRPFLSWQALSDVTAYDDGNGTLGAPYEIATLTQLLRLSEMPSDWAPGIYFELTGDIDASATSTWNGGLGFSPIGNFSIPFSGSFDGSGHVITGLTINRPSQGYIGLFGSVLSGSVQRLGLQALNVSGTDNVGGLFGRLDLGTVSSCYATGSVSGNRNVGGLVGYNGGTVSSCYATGDVSGSVEVGGLVGYNSGPVSSCYATAGVPAVGTNVGGLAGQNFATVNSCYWDKESSGTTTGIGGGTLTGATGLTSAQMVVQSSFAGFDFTTTPEWRIFDGATRPFLPWQTVSVVLSQIAYAGGDGSSGTPYQIATLGQLLRLSETPSDWAAGKYFELTADIDASATSTWDGGLGFSPIGNSGTPFSGSFDGKGYIITGLSVIRPSEQYVGLFGYLGGSVQRVGLETLSVSGIGDVGGLVGFNDGGTVSSCYATGSVSGSAQVGGLVGYNVSGTVSSCYATGTVSGLYSIGGLIGYSDGGTVSSCYATGSVTGDSQVGGLVGYNGGTVNSCYATGSVSGNSSVGGLVGINGGTVSSCYWDTETSGTATGMNGTIAGATGLTSAEMVVQSSFTGFDFITTPEWRIFDGTTRPFLPWQSVSVVVSQIAYAGGDGSSGTPYQIASLGQLLRLSETPSDWAAGCTSS